MHKVIRRGMCWGDDFMLVNEDMRLSPQALAVSFLTIATLGIVEFDEVLLDFPSQMYIRRRMHVRNTLVRGLVQAAEQQKALKERLEVGSEGSPKSGASFTGKLQA